MTTQAPPPPPPSSAEPLAFPCTSCGAQMTYEPGTEQLQCPSCGAEQAIPDQGKTIVEHSFEGWKKAPKKPVATIGKQTLTCQRCGATTETDQVADACQFCGGVLVAATQPEGVIVPEAVVPFGIDRSKANEAFGKWVKSRWFAPNALKKVGSTESIKGTYVPHWTYDAHTETDYDGKRGEHYYETVTRNGETHREQRTRWYHASGHVRRDFDDVIVPGTGRVDQGRLDKMGPWKLESAEAFDPSYLAGYAALRYDVDPDTGLNAAQQQMKNVIETDCKDDIGGDEQRVSSMNIKYSQVMFKLVLLPLWIASYVYGGKLFQVMVNANTGEVVGDRPYSKAKIAMAVIAAVIVIAAGIAIYYATKGSGSSGAG